MIPKVCNVLCWGVPDSPRSSKSLDEKNPEVRFTKDDMDKFETYLSMRKGVNFLQRFFDYNKECKNPELHVENLLFKIALIEHFIACKKFLEEVASLSPNGIRGYLLVDSRVKKKEKISLLFEFCQKRALFMIEFKPFRNFLKNYPIMREKTLAKKMKVLRKLKKKIKIFNIDFFNIRTSSEATNIILDYRLIFYNKLAKFSISYLTLICAYCHIAKPVQLYEICEIFRDIKLTVETINTKFFMLVSNEAIEKFSPIEIDEEMILAVEHLYQEMGKKTTGEFDEEVVNGIFQKIIDHGLQIIKQFKILSDRHHFSGLEAFLLERVTGRSRLEKLTLSRRLSLSPKKKERRKEMKERKPMDKQMVMEMIKKNINKAKENRFSKRKKRFEEKRLRINSSTESDKSREKEIEYDDEELEEILKEDDSEYKGKDKLSFLSTIREVSDYSGTMRDGNMKNSEMNKKNSEEDEEGLK